MNNDGGPAFPTTTGIGIDDQEVCKGVHGMSLRDYFEAHAPPLPAYFLEKYIEAEKVNDPIQWEVPCWSDWHYRRIAIQEARWRRQYADVMLEARKS